MLTRNDLTDYIADNYGQCVRGSNCYHGTDRHGHFDGCLKVGWRGRDCPHWRPTTATTWEELKDTHSHEK